MPLQVKVSGFAEIDRNFDLLRDMLQERAMRAAVRNASQVMAEEMISQAPVLDEKTPGSWAETPGALKSSIRVTVRKLKDGYYMAVIGPKGYPSRVAHLVEFGHRLVKGGKSRIGAMGPVGSGKEIGEVPEHPFLRPAFEASAQKVLDRWAEEIRKSLSVFLQSVGR